MDWVAIEGLRVFVGLGRALLVELEDGLDFRGCSLLAVYPLSHASVVICFVDAGFCVYVRLVLQVDSSFRGVHVHSLILC